MSVSAQREREGYVVQLGHCLNAVDFSEAFVKAPEKGKGGVAMERRIREGC